MGTPGYAGEFKAGAVSQIVDRGCSISEVSRRWVKSDPWRSRDAVAGAANDDLAAAMCFASQSE